MSSKRKNVAGSGKTDSSTAENDLIPVPNISRIKNKHLRTEMFKKQQNEKRKLKIKDKKQKKKEREKLGDKAPPKNVPKTIENQRVRDETMVAVEDDEVLHDEACDELGPYFRRETTPQIIITSSENPHKRTKTFCRQLAAVIPNAKYFYRKVTAIKKIIPQAIERGYTDIIVVNEDRRIPNALLLSHLPDGPTAHFKLSMVKLKKEIGVPGAKTSPYPEVLLNNFNTRLGRSVARMFAALFPQDAKLQEHRVVTFHNQRDFIFFRHHRFDVPNEKRARLKELGPQFTLKLRSLQRGAFDSTTGEYIWVHKRREMESNRRKFFM